MKARLKPFVKTFIRELTVTKNTRSKWAEHYRQKTPKMRIDEDFYYFERTSIRIQEFSIL